MRIKRVGSIDASKKRRSIASADGLTLPLFDDRESRVVAIALQSGSNGNCIYVETEDVRLLFDAGIPGSHAEKRLAAYGRDIREVDAVIISHDHADHVRCAGVLQRKYHLPLYMTRSTHEAAKNRCPLGTLNEVRHFRAGQVLHIKNVRIETIPTPHDAADGVAFVVEAACRRLGILTDLGHVFEGLTDIVKSLDGVFLESNYDPEMLRVGSYPDFLKRRIEGPHGHISNQEAAKLLCSAMRSNRMKWACLAHLSEENNQPALAIATHQRILPSDFTLHVASRYESVGSFIL